MNINTKSISTQEPIHNSYLAEAYDICENPYKVLNKRELEFLVYLKVKTCIVHNVLGNSRRVIGQEIDYSYINLNSLYKLIADYTKDDPEKLKSMIFDPSTENIYNWVHSLVAITSINYNEAIEIALARINYKTSKILEEMKTYDESNYYKKEIMKKWKRYDPLEKIKNLRHGVNIIQSHARHVYTNYNELLKEAEIKSNLGLIKRKDKKKYAQSNYKMK